MNIYIIEKQEFDKWLSDIKYTEYQDTKGYGGISYINCSAVADKFPRKNIVFTVKRQRNGA